MSNKEAVINTRNGKSIRSVKSDCKTANVVYAAKCIKHDLLYIGQTNKKITERFSNHRYDFKKRPENNELTTHLTQEPHDFEKDIEVTIIGRGYPNKESRIRGEDKSICQLGTCAPHGMNKEIGPYGRELYECYQSLQK